MTPRRFPPPWQIEEREECFIVHDATGQPLGYFYFEDEPVRQRSTKRLSKDEARRIAVNVAKLAICCKKREPEGPQQLRVILFVTPEVLRAAKLFRF